MNDTNKYLSGKEKFWVFLGTLVAGFVVTSNTVISDGFTGFAIRNWVMDSLLVAAILGFGVVKYLQHKGKWQKNANRWW